MILINLANAYIEINYFYIKNVVKKNYIKSKNCILNFLLTQFIDLILLIKFANFTHFSHTLAFIC